MISLRQRQPLIFSFINAAAITAEIEIMMFPDNKDLDGHENTSREDGRSDNIREDVCNAILQPRC